MKDASLPNAKDVRRPQGYQLWRFYGQDTLLKVPQLKFFELQLVKIEVLPHIKIWRLAPNFDIWKNFNCIHSPVEVRRTSTEEV